jgi:TatD DNase family protein
MKLFDSHSHLHFPKFDADRAEVLARMQERGVGSVLIGTDLATSREALELATQHQFLWAAVGLHPNDNIEEVFNTEAFETLAQEDKVVAIGECGLDYFRSGSTAEEKAAQKERFLQHIELAEHVHKALVIHCRDAHDDMLAILSAHKLRVPVVMHFFTGSGELAQQYLDLGCYLSFPGPVTYTDMYDDSIRVAPLEKILIETDAPFAAPVPYRGKRNEPVYVQEVAKKVAAVKGLSPEEVMSATTQNAKIAFGLPL